MKTRGKKIWKKHNPEKCYRLTAISLLEQNSKNLQKSALVSLSGFGSTTENTNYFRDISFEIFYFFDWSVSLTIWLSLLAGGEGRFLRELSRLTQGVSLSIEKSLRRHQEERWRVSFFSFLLRERTLLSVLTLRGQKGAAGGFFFNLIFFNQSTLSFTGMSSTGLCTNTILQDK